MSSAHPELVEIKIIYRPQDKGMSAIVYMDGEEAFSYPCDEEDSKRKGKEASVIAYWLRQAFHGTPIIGLTTRLGE